MKPTSFENAIRLQFDTLMKKVIDGIIKNYEKELDRRSNREIPFCELPKIVVNSFPVFDDYELDVTIFDVYGMEARVSGNELCKALQQLPERKRNNENYQLSLTSSEDRQWYELIMKHTHNPPASKNEFF
ncbi:sigma-70 family RNA polymerase sigma factor [Dorea longicatena]|uniref:sigma-70 family RNA polymerase sigma factor n=1 Tax=Dorea longicatena TaxID=88431 RepID=UPI00157019CD|nr:sigma-70 family RNA polymerase sigma factor [Dorea longicatena]NSD06889.1 sigma-70 family RNA polymerase sigma factor [Dorea longicatena]NSD18611.1 sigma-70 family RNA polymerase sigma factor [Dorea longicatena]NSK13157.1 sigma-70 family RNA polymerase sigma factor [Blautia sp. MSK.20.9]